MPVFAAAAPGPSTTTTTATTTHTTPQEKLKEIPPEFWLKFGLGVVIFIAAIIALRKLAHMNKIVMGAIVFVILAVLGFSWIYERNEPAFMTPAIERIAPFFPTKGAYNNKQQVAPKI